MGRYWRWLPPPTQHQPTQQSSRQLMGKWRTSLVMSGFICVLTIPIKYVKCKRIDYFTTKPASQHPYLPFLWVLQVGGGWSGGETFSNVLVVALHDGFYLDSYKFSNEPVKDKSEKNLIKHLTIFFFYNMINNNTLTFCNFLHQDVILKSNDTQA